MINVSNNFFNPMAHKTVYMLKIIVQFSLPKKGDQNVASLKRDTKMGAHMDKKWPTGV